MIIKDDRGNKRFIGMYRGYIADTDDPRREYRIKAVVPEVTGPQTTTPWATPCLPHGGVPDQIEAKNLRRGAGVWIQFEQGLANRPIYCGFWPSSPEGVSQIPKFMRENSDDPEAGGNATFTKGEDSVTTHTGTDIDEPSPPSPGKYPFVTGMKTHSGMVEEWDDVNQKHQIFHPSGSYREERSDGKVIDKVVDDRHEITLGKLLNHANELLEVIDQDLVRTVTGDIDEQSQNKTVTVLSQLTETIDKIDATIQSDTKITVDSGSISLTATLSDLTSTLKSLTVTILDLVQLTATTSINLTAPNIALNGATALNGSVTIGGLVIPSPTAPTLTLGGADGLFLVNENIVAILESALLAANGQSYQAGTISGATGTILTKLVKAQ